MGWLRWMAPVEPWKAASPKLNTPPSEAISQYPWWSGVGVTATTGWVSGRGMEGEMEGAPSSAWTEPSEWASHRPWPPGPGTMPTTPGVAAGALPASPKEEIDPPAAG